MAGNTGPSFIPKRTPQKKTPKRNSRQIYMLAYVSYVVFFGGLIACAGVFVYKLQVTNQLVERQQALANERNKFSQAEMERMVELEKRLEYTADRVANNVSIKSVLDSVDGAIADPILFTELTVERSTDEEDNGLMLVEAKILTDSFNSTIFQREIMKENPQVKSVVVKELGLAAADNNPLANLDEDEVTLADVALLSATRISFLLELELPTEDVIYNPAQPTLNEAGDAVDDSIEDLAEGTEEIDDPDQDAEATEGSATTSDSEEVVDEEVEGDGVAEETSV